MGESFHYYSWIQDFEADFLKKVEADFLKTRVRKQPIIALYFESENELKFHNLEAWLPIIRIFGSDMSKLKGLRNFGKINTVIMDLGLGGFATR